MIKTKKIFPFLQPESHAMVLVALLYALLASTFLLAKYALQYGKPFFLIGVRMIVAGGLLLGYQAMTRGWRVPIRDWPLFLQAALFHVYLAFILEYWALQYLSALKTTMIYSATPFVSALLSYFLLRERLTNKKLLGIVIGLAGMVPVIAAQAGDSLGGQLTTAAWPEVILFAAVVSAAYAWFIVKKLMDRGYSLLIINGISMLLGGLGSLATSLALEGTSNLVTDPYRFAGWVLALILISNIVVYNFYGWLMHRYSLTFISFSGFLCPGFATLYDWLLQGGALSWHYIVSLCLVTVGLYLFYRDELRRNTR